MNDVSKCWFVSPGVGGVGDDVRLGPLGGGGDRHGVDRTEGRHAPRQVAVFNARNSQLEAKPLHFEVCSYNKS